MEGRSFGIVNKLVPIGLIFLTTACHHMDMSISVLYCDGTNEKFIYCNDFLRMCYGDSNNVSIKYKNGIITDVIVNKEKDSPMAKVYYSLNDIKPVFEQFGIFIEYPEAFVDHVKLAYLMGYYYFSLKRDMWRDSLTSNNSHIFVSRIDRDISFPNAEIGHVENVSFEVKDSCLIKWSYLWDHNYTGFKEQINYDYQYYENKRRIKSVRVYTWPQDSIDSCMQFFYYDDQRKETRFKEIGDGSQ